MSDVGAFIRFVRELYGQREGAIALHAPTMGQREKAWVNQAIDSTFVSSVGAFVTEFEQRIAAFVGARHAVATVNGTAALHVALRVAGVQPGDLVLTQALTFVATCNAITYCGAEPVFVDVEAPTLGMNPDALAAWLADHAVLAAGQCVERQSGRVIRACVPMHTLGHPARVDAIAQLCDRWGLALIEDAAEALGSYRAGRHVGTFGRLGAFSFNGNKVITTGGGGAVVTDDEALARWARHLTTTAKRVHPWLFDHDEVGYNYRMPNLNAAFGIAQWERLPALLSSKRQVADAYRQWADRHGWCFVQEPSDTRSNYWLNAFCLPDLQARDAFLQATNAAGVMTRPLWTPMHRLPIYQRCRRGDLPVTEKLSDTVVNVPSSALTQGDE
ncbi:MAG: LegC family aminotransferase [Pseudomonadota bacterium]